MDYDHNYEITERIWKQGDKIPHKVAGQTHDWSKADMRDRYGPNPVDEVYVVTVVAVRPRRLFVDYMERI